MNKDDAMIMRFPIEKMSFVTMFLLMVNATCFADDADSKESEKSVSAAEQILGKWVQYRDTKQGRVKLIKDHRGDYTILTVYGPTGQRLYSHRSEYEVDGSGSVNVFRYRNKVILTGPNEGEKDPKESAYIFRIEGDRFLELHGMLRADQGKPSMIIWERLKENELEPQSDQRTT